MIEGKPSFTAAVVAALRGFGKYLASPLNKAGLDPYGLQFAGQPFTGLDALLGASLLLRKLCFGRDSAFLSYASTTHVLRTVAIDSAVESFQRSHGKQVVILGAGFDARALRLHAAMPGMRWVEVDAPASQAAKRDALARVGAPGDDGPDIRFVAHDFETETGEQLKAKLVDAGLDLTLPILSIMEGVVMYLTPAGAESTFALLYDISAPGSGVVFSHIPPSGLDKLSPWCVNWWLRLIFKHVFHESLNFGGWEPEVMEKWFQQRGWHLLWERGYGEVARQAGCTPSVEAAVAGDFQRVAMAMVRRNPVTMK
jgi:methyltransferase (TIGR00027 family)